MTLDEFYGSYPDELSCRMKVRELRESAGIVCKKCGHTHHYWKKDKKVWECKACHYRTSLRSGTIMENSNLPFRYWFIAIAHLSHTKKSISALELQKELGHKRYEPIWAMLHKLRKAMGKRDENYQLSGEIELDEGFFESPSNSDKVEGYGNGGDKTKVLVAAESWYVNEEQTSKSKKKHNKPKAVGFIKMKIIEKGNQNQVLKEASQIIDKQSRVVTDDHKSYKKFPDIVSEHISIRCFDKSSTSKVLPWVHTVISNAKRLLLGIHHYVSRQYLQYYLDEFCYKFNRRYFKDKLFDRLLIAAFTPN